MYRKKDFNYMDVIHISGKKIGFVNDLLIDMNEKKVKGFSVSSYSLFQKSTCIFMEDIISFDTVMIVSRTSKQKYLPFNELKNMDVTDGCGNIIGMVEEIVFEPEHFKIMGMVASTGFINNFIQGKEILLTDNLLIGDNNILYHDKCEKMKLKSIPHILPLEDDEDEKAVNKENN